MIWRDETSRPRGGEAGFTLLELIVVFVILGLVLMLFVTRISGPSPGLTLRAAANELAAGLRQARSSAIARNRTVIVEIDATHRDWRGVDGTVKWFPANAAVGIVLADGNISRDGNVAIRFEPDGSSTGGLVDLAAGAQRLAVAVNWITGRVTVANAR